MSRTYLMVNPAQVARTLSAALDAGFSLEDAAEFFGALARGLEASRPQDRRPAYLDDFVNATSAPRHVGYGPSPADDAVSAYFSESPLRVTSAQREQIEAHDFDGIGTEDDFAASADEGRIVSRSVLTQTVEVYAEPEQPAPSSPVSQGEDVPLFIFIPGDSTFLNPDVTA